MNLFKAFKIGIFQVNQHKSMLLIVFVANFFLALILAIPMNSALQDSMGYSLVQDNLVKGFDYDWWQEFTLESKGFIRSFTPSIIGAGAFLLNLETLIQGTFHKLPTAILWLGIIYLLLSTFFSGGILGFFNSNEPKFSLRVFFNHCGNYFPRFFRLFLYSLPFYLIVYLVIQITLGYLADSLTREAFTEKPWFFGNLAVDVFTVVLLCFVNMTFDYAKIKTIVHDSKIMIEQVYSAFQFVFKNFGQTVGLYYLIGLMGVVLVIIYVILHSWIPQTAWVTILIFFIIQQLYILSKLWVKFTFYSSQLAFYKACQSEK